MTNFTITADGLLSPLLFEGAASLETIWRPVNTKDAPKNATPHKRMAPPDLRVRGAMTEAQIAAQLEPAIRAALATGQIHDEANLRTNLTAAGRRFTALGARLDAIQVAGSPWEAQTFRLEIPVTASGDVTPVISSGVALLFRFDWERTDPNNVVKAIPSPSPGARDDLGDLVQGIAQDLGAGITPGEAELAGYPLEVIRIGAGFTAAGTIGIAAVSAQAVGSFEFTRNLTAAPISPPSSVSGASALSSHSTPATPLREIPIIAARERAARAGLANDAFTPDSGQTVLINLDHAKFKKGLQKALSIGAFFAARAAKAPHAKGWAVSEFSTEYDLSVTGDLGWLQTGGTSVVELTFASAAGAP